jgi:hypothetical protein
MITGAYFLAPSSGHSTPRAMVRQLSLLWKFDLYEITPDRDSEANADGSVFLVALATGDEVYQDAIARLAHNSSRCILFATSSVAT